MNNNMWGQKVNLLFTRMMMLIVASIHYLVIDTCRNIIFPFHRACAHDEIWQDRPVSILIRIILTLELKYV